MLSDISITDLGVIEEATLDLGPGLTVVTGETGAGKTMVVTGLGLLFGQRADAGLVRDGASRTVVEGIATLPAGHPARERAIEAGAADESELVLLRSVTSEGRSRAHVGGRACPIGVLADVGRHLVAVHGQADQWRLRHQDEHRSLLDRFGGDDVGAALASYQDSYAAHAAAANELAELQGRARERAREAAELTAGLERIEALDPKPGEDHALRIEAERLGHVEELRFAAAEASALLAGADDASGVDDAGVLGRLARARATLQHAGRNDPELAALGRRAVELGHLATELSADVASYVAGLDVEPGRLDDVQARRAALRELTRLYGDDIDEVLRWSANAAGRLGSLVGDDDRIEFLGAEVQRLAVARDVAAACLSEARRAAATRLAARITEELTVLAMPSAQVAIDVRPSDPTGMGADEVEIGLRANTGGTLRPIAKAASGGELSRIMLAIEVATAAASDGPPTFVFDEVDAGIGGRAAIAVGARLAALAEHAQVIVVTHLAQVAAHAGRHLVVHKSDDGSVTRTGVRRVEGEERIQELARMLGGTDSVAALEHARDLVRHVTGATGGAWEDGTDVPSPPPIA